MTNIWLKNKKSNVKLIAEIGCNHKGNFKIAEKMIEIAAKFSGADIIKFQKRNPKELLSSKEYNAPHPNPVNSYGKTYGEHREYLEFNIFQHKKLKKICEKFKKIYSVSVWDISSFEQIKKIKPKMIKIPSAHNLDFKLIDFILLSNFKGDIHLSLGMTTKKEERKIINLFHKRKKLNKLVLYTCTSKYPAESNEINIKEIKRLKTDYGNKVKGIGFSGHHNGIGVDNLSVAFGASFIERHFTLDRTWKGTDQAASLEPDGLRRLKSLICETEQALTFRPSGLPKYEIEQRKKLKKITTVR